MHTFLENDSTGILKYSWELSKSGTCMRFCFCHVVKVPGISGGDDKSEQSDFSVSTSGSAVPQLERQNSVPHPSINITVQGKS